MIKIILTEVPEYGWLPTIEVDGKEIYRGEFRGSIIYAATKAQDTLSLITPINQEILDI